MVVRGRINSESGSKCDLTELACPKQLKVFEISGPHFLGRVKLIKTDEQRISIEGGSGERIHSIINK